MIRGEFRAAAPKIPRRPGQCPDGCRSMHTLVGTSLERGVVAGSFARMAALVADGSIKIIELHAVPRSMSTALGRSLLESGATGVFVNEPFNLHNGDVNVAAGYVLCAIEPTLAAAREPVVVLTKNLASFVTASAFRTWSDVCSSVVWCVRDPRIQISSLVTRTVNGLLFDVASDRLKQSDLLPSHVVAAAQWLQDSDGSTDFSLAGWRAIGAHFADCVGRLPSLVVDGSLFSRMPDRLLPYLCSELGIEFRDRMIDGWEKPFVNVHRLYDPEYDEAANAWIKHAATSRGVELIEKPPLEESVLPEALRDHLFAVALPTYEMFMRAFYSQDNLAQYRLDPRHTPS